jgi:tripartite ATP-independent transporter DctP family solute receptor
MIRPPLHTLIAVVCLPLLLVSCGDRDRADAPVVLKVSSVLPPGHPTARALEFFEERVEALSRNRIEVKLFFSGQLGSAVETIELCRGGNIEIVHCSSTYLTHFCPLLKVLDMPFIFRDSAHQHAVLDGKTGAILKKELETLDLELLAFFHAGSRNIMTKQGPITSPDQLAGMKIRVMPSPLLLDSINAIGASAIPMSQSEVYSALQMGVLDGWENNPATALNFRMYETGCIYYAQTSHSSIPDLLLMSDRSFQRLPAELQEVVLRAATESQSKQREIWAAAETEAVTELEDAGMVFTEVNSDLFKAEVDAVYEAMFARYGEEFKSLCLQIQETRP